jgi:hypothetical protein
MLTQALRRAALVIAIAAVVTSSWPTAARANGGQPGGRFGGAQYGQSHTPAAR